MIKLKEILSKEEIQNPVLSQMLEYKKDDAIQFLFVVEKDDVQKGIMIAMKSPNSELQMVYFGSHYLLEQALPLYKEAIQQKLTDLPA